MGFSPLSPNGWKSCQFFKVLKSRLLYYFCLGAGSDLQLLNVQDKSVWKTDSVTQRFRLLFTEAGK